MKTALVLGAGGFIGNHLVNRLKSEGYWVRGVDLKYPQYSKSQADEMLIYDLRNPKNVEAVMRQDKTVGVDGFEGEYEGKLPFKFLPTPYSVTVPFDEVYQLAADMGGCQYIFTGINDADIMSNSALININVATWSHIYKVGKVFYSSSACIYPGFKQDESTRESIIDFGLKESDAYPAQPDSEYGWEKLFSERLWMSYAKNYDLDVRIARLHNIFGPQGVYKGGKEKAPASICRKVAQVNNHSNIEMWGDGQQMRSFLYIDDCIDAIRLLMQSQYNQPINIGSHDCVTIRQLWELAIEVSQKDLSLVSIPRPDNILGVHNRNSNNDLVESMLNWKPKHSLEYGIIETYNWIKAQLQKDGNR